MIFNENGILYINDNNLIHINESMITDIGRVIHKAADKFLKSIKELIWNCISFIENNVFTKNKFFYDNKNKIIEELSGKTFEGYMFRIFQDRYGAISKLEAAVKTQVSDIITNKSYSDQNIMDYVRGLLVGDNLKDVPYVINCTKDDFQRKAKEYIYGASDKGLHLINNIHGGVSGMIDRMMDKQINIKKLKDLYKSFERYTKDMVETRKNHINDEDLHQWIHIIEDHMNTCYTYMNIIIQAIRDEYAQSYKLCTSVLL